MSRLMSLLNYLEEQVLALLLAAMTLVTFTQVVSRYVFNSGAVWALELTIYLFAWLMLLGASYGIRVKAHIGVDLLVKRLAPPVRKCIALIIIPACIAYAVLLLIGGYQTVDLLMLIQVEAEDLPIQRWIPTMIIPVAAALMILRLLEVMIAVLKNEADGLGMADEAKDAVEHFDIEAEGQASSHANPQAKL